MVTASEKQSHVVCARVPEVSADERIIPFWYRGSMHVDPLHGNGKETELEKSIREFEAWQSESTVGGSSSALRALWSLQAGRHQNKNAK